MPVILAKLKPIALFIEFVVAGIGVCRWPGPLVNGDDVRMVWSIHKPPRPFANRNTWRLALNIYILEMGCNVLLHVYLSSCYPEFEKYSWVPSVLIWNLGVNLFMLNSGVS
ncbi:MAG: hypothetical protein JWR35_3668 [Marmoricola sp.]|nr:hypothetical protein [Marmoricola sp.]